MQDGESIDFDEAKKEPDSQMSGYTLQYSKAEIDSDPFG
jgi:hypothetical protein